MHKKERGFTLIELLIVIAIIAIIAGVVFVALNPAKRFADTRDARRANDVAALLSAIKVNQVDNGGSYLTEIQNATATVNYMIGTGSAACNATCANMAATSTGACIDLGGLVTGGYLGSVPVSPNGTGTWTADYSGYTLMKATTGIITINACDAEGVASIQASR